MRLSSYPEFYSPTSLAGFKLICPSCPAMYSAPEIESILVECPSGTGPYGAKGVGEPPCIEPPATIANAIAAATGLWIQSLPITAEKVLFAMRHRGKQ